MPVTNLFLAKAAVSVGLSVLACILGASTCLSAVEPIRCNSDGNICFLRITGTITSDDARAVTRIQSELPKNFGQKFGLLIVPVDSRGGEVEAAMQIGRALRSLRAYVNVAPAARCSSSCVFILAGATKRLVLGSVSIHRLYSAGTSTTDYQKAQQFHRRLEADVRGFLRDMNVPEALFDAMMRVPSEQFRLLSAAEIESFGLGNDDPVEEDLVNSQTASKYGLTKPEYLQRKAKVDQLCKPLLDAENLTLAQGSEKYLQCSDSILSAK